MHAPMLRIVLRFRVEQQQEKASSAEPASPESSGSCGLAAAVFRTLSRTSALMARQRVQGAARRDRRARFTALLQYISPVLL